MKTDYDTYLEDRERLFLMHTNDERCSVCKKTYKWDYDKIVSKTFVTGMVWYHIPCPRCGSMDIALYKSGSKTIYERMKKFERENAEFLKLAEKDLTNRPHDVTLVLEF